MADEVGEEEFDEWESELAPTSSYDQTQRDSLEWYFKKIDAGWRFNNGVPPINIHDEDK